MGLPDKAQKVFDKVAAWDRDLAKKWQDKFNLSDYQMLWLAFTKGLIIGMIIIVFVIIKEFFYKPEENYGEIVLPKSIKIPNKSKLETIYFDNDNIEKDVYEILWIATQSAIDIAKPGITLSDLWQIMVEKLDKYLPKNYSYGRFGHGMGLQLTEPPSITFDNKMELVSNMVLTIEPSIEFLPGKIMVHEENILVTKDGPQLLTTRAPKELPIIN